MIQLTFADGKYDDEVLDYQVDWTDRVGDEAIVGSPTAEITGAEIESVSTTGNITTVRISGGGTVRRTLYLFVTAETDSGQVHAARITLPILTR